MEVIEAHYLFDIPYNKIKVLIHPEAIVHSIVEKIIMALYEPFKNDMSIPIFNFNDFTKVKIKYIDKFYTPSFDNLNFMEVSSSIFPIYTFFIKMNKSNPAT